MMDRRFDFTIEESEGHIPDNGVENDAVFLWLVAEPLQEIDLKLFSTTVTRTCGTNTIHITVNE